MNTIPSLLGMIATEAFEAALLPPPDGKDKETPSFLYTTELTQTPEGKLVWVDGGLPK